MKAIVVKYLGPTNSKGSRLKASAEGVKSLVVSYDHGATNPHRDAAVALANRQGWKGELIEGGLPDGQRVFVFAS